ncbi:hypothetical protein LDENG_00046740 [Lucifuga dentata]|nr:hypothetical protein LDENG_00046740 [Lucifuga dentata]
MDCHPLIRVQVAEAADSADRHTLPVPSQALYLLLGDSQVFPGQPGDIVSPACPGSSLGPLPSWTCLEDLPRETTRRHPY